MTDAQHINRFWSKVYMIPCGGCWLWEGAPDKYGYGRFWLKGKTGKAHRFVLELAKGPHPPEKPLGLHHCDNRMCVNPEHLYWGDPQDNMTDKVARGRATTCPGETHTSSKLTDEKVIEMRRLWAAGEVSQKDLALRFGVGRRHVNDLINRKRWTHV